MNNKYFKHFLFFLFVITLARLLISVNFNLVPQEAYYWLYTKHPALSYFDHPPACSYTIWIFSRILGDSEFAVRIGMILYSVGTCLFLFFLSKDYFSSEEKAFKTILLLNLTIFFNLHSIVATPDAPLLFFWSGAMYFFHRALFFGDRWRDWILGGIFSGFALLSKYTAVFIFFNLALFLIWSKQWKKILSYKFFASVVIALLVFSPVIIWNIQNHFASFLFQTSGRAKGLKKIGFNYLFQLIASQIYELTPLFFFLLFAVLFKYLTNLKTVGRSDKYLLCFAYPITIFFFLVSLSTLVKMNWILPGYLSFIILALNFYVQSKEKTKKIIKFVGLPISFGLIALNFVLIILPIAPIERGDSWTGWKELAGRIQELKQNLDRQNKNFIFSNEYKIPAELAFYTPYRDVILAENVYGRPALQFDFWFDVQNFAGWDGILVYSDYNPSIDLDEVRKYFQQIKLIEEFRIIKNDKVFRKFYIYHCIGYAPPQNN